MASAGGTAISAGPTPPSATATSVEWHQRSPNPKNPVVFFDVTIGSIPAGRIKMELFADIAPKTVFRYFSKPQAVRNRTRVGKIFWFIFHTLPQCHTLQGVGNTYL
jgi:hypothetical protein